MRNACGHRDRCVCLELYKTGHICVKKQPQVEHFNERKFLFFQKEILSACFSLLFCFLVCVCIYIKACD